MSAAHPGSPGLQAAAPFELCSAGLGQGPLLDGLDLQQVAGSGLACLGQAYPSPSPASNSGLLGGLLGASQAPLGDPLAQLVALQQQQQLAAALEAEASPLASLSSLLAAQQLGARVQELLLLKHHLQAAVPPPRPGGGIRGTGPLANPLYKTELCRSWEETGSCRYGAKCQFAHGREELRPVVRHPKYKTEVCRTFAQSGTCPYGTRCRFIHTTSPPASAAGSPAASTLRAGSTTPNAGNSAGPTPTPSRDASFTSLAGLGASTPPTPPLASYRSASGLSASFAPAGAASPASPLLSPADAATAAAAASLLGLQSVGGTAAASLGAYNGAAAALGGGYGAGAYGFGLAGVPAVPASPYAQLGVGADAQTLAALAALLGAGTGYGAQAASPVPLTAAAALTTSPALLGVVGTPAGLAPIGTMGQQAPTLASSLSSLGLAAAQQGPACPTTPLGTPPPGAAAALRRSISDSDTSTPNSSAKRLPIFEQLIIEPAPSGDTNLSAFSADNTFSASTRASFDAGRFSPPAADGGAAGYASF